MTDLIEMEEQQMGADFGPIHAQLVNMTEVDTAIVALLDDVKGKLDAALAAGADPAEIQAIADSIGAQKDVLASAIVRDTPAAPVVPGTGDTGGTTPPATGTGDGSTTPPATGTGDGTTPPPADTGTTGDGTTTTPPPADGGTGTVTPPADGTGTTPPADTGTGTAPSDPGAPPAAPSV